MKKSLKDRIKALPTLDEMIEKDLTDPQFAAEYQRASLRTAIARASKTAREKAGLTQDQLAQRLGVKQAAVGRIESLKAKSLPGIDLLANIAFVTGADITIDHPRVHFKIGAKKKPAARKSRRRT